MRKLYSNLVFVKRSKFPYESKSLGFLYESKDLGSNGFPSFNYFVTNGFHHSTTGSCHHNCELVIIILRTHFKKQLMWKKKKILDFNCHLCILTNTFVEHFFIRKKKKTFLSNHLPVNFSQDEVSHLQIIVLKDYP